MMAQPSLAAYMKTAHNLGGILFLNNYVRSTKTLYFATVRVFYGDDFEGKN